MIKIVKIVILTAFAFLLIFIISGLISRLYGVKKNLEHIASLPSFSFMTLAKDNFNSSEIEKGPVLIVRFHPECEHCQYEISQIFESDIPEFVPWILLISEDQPESISKFLDQFKYTDYPSIIALSDSTDSFGDIFGKDIIPSNYIYNKELKLVKVFHGEVKTETIRKHLLPDE